MFVVLVLQKPSSRLTLAYLKSILFFFLIPRILADRIPVVITGHLEVYCWFCVWSVANRPYPAKTSIRRGQKGEHGHGAASFVTHSEIKLDKRLQIFLGEWYTSNCLMSLTGRNWLGWTLNVNVIECFLHCAGPYGGPRGWGQREGGGICSNKRGKKC